ncbi:DUF817 domain-containing protein [Microbacterium esteraromaticum]|uniref:DUF817 domain-containing protein n=1 Tax=Microbacterium esteraromaticum TaxID=57043 RepID=UPI001CD420C6|nr:DUF817 domain-containing protein [Microbacterium esteraromaticum]MCA1305832.1 DUF817 domain-containing protein [Microbacterium esteraromaticum]
MQWGTALEQRVDAIADRMLQDAAARGARAAAIEFIVFVLKQAWACIFGAALLVALIAARLLYPDDAALARNDALTLAAVLIQVAMLVFGLETVRELRVIVLFHITGTVMELFKTDVGSWAYAAEGVLRIGGVPLFSGFMYAVGSYMVRVYRLFDLRFSRYPRRWLTAIVAAAIYANFFTHHFWWDARWVLFGAVVVLWGGTVMHARIRVRIVRLPLLLVFAGVALFLWVAENIGTWAGAWVYPDQVAGWQLVSLSKMGSWFLLMIISVVLVAWVYPPRAPMASSPEPIEAPPVQQERPR